MRTGLSFVRLLLLGVWAMTIACGGHSSTTVSAPSPTPAPTAPEPAGLTIGLPADIRAGAAATVTITVTITGAAVLDLAIDFGDGTSEQLGALRAGSTVVVVTHTYRLPGLYMLTTILTGVADSRMTASAPVFVR